MNKNLSFFERYLSVWVFLCIIGGILLGKAAPEIATTLNDFSIHQVSVPIALCQAERAMASRPRENRHVGGQVF